MENVAANPRIDDLRKRLEREPNSRLFAQLAEELRKEGEFEEAIRVAREGLGRHPAYPSARMTLGRALFDTGDVAAARGELESVLKGAPDNILASRLLAECLESLGEVEGALARYRATQALTAGDKHIAERIRDLEAKAGRVAAPASPSPSPAEPPASVPASAPIPVSQIDEPMVLETWADRMAAGPEPTAIPLVEGPAEFEGERPYEAPALQVAPAPSSASAPTALSASALFAEQASERTTQPMEFEFEADLPPERMPAEPAPPVPPTPPPAGDAELISPTLAELYFNQGLPDKAVEVYRRLLEREPHNERARARLAELEAPAAAAPSPAGGDEVEASAEAGAARREALEGAIGRLESLRAALQKGPR